MNFRVIAVVFFAYLVGAIPVGYIIARLKGIADIRKHGSGNIGATNVSRLLGLPYFFLIFFLDAGKAFLFLHFIAPYFPLTNLYFFACMLLVGNGYSPLLYGSGGKGVATLFGLVAAVQPIAVIVLLGAWLLVFSLTRIVGIASVIAVCTLPVYAFFIHNYALCKFFCFVAFWIVWTHRSNIRAYWEKHCVKG